jgi:type I restriction enzyme, S subunit
MGFKIINQPFKNLANDNFLRTDFSYIDIVENNFSKKMDRRLAEFLIFLETGKAIKKEDYSEEESSYVHVVVKNIRYNRLDISDSLFINEEKGEFLNEFRLQKNDIVIAISSNVGASFLYEGESDLNLTLSHYLARVRVNEEKVIPKYLSYYLNSEFIKKYFRATETGKTQKNLSKWYIRNLPIFFNENIEIQKKIIEKIEPIENEIINIIASQRSEADIINEVFAEEFNYDKNLWRNFGKGMTAGTQKSNEKTLSIFAAHFSELENSETMRFSSRFHRPEVKRIQEILNKYEVVKVKSCLKDKELIHRGKQPINSENGYIPAIKTGQLKNSYIDLSDTDLVTEDFYNKQLGARVNKDDILIASTGKVSLGKVDLFEEELEAVCDGHISIVRIDNNKLLSEYFVYYFRSILGSFQIERDYTGATNQIELYANEINSFDIIKLSLNDQAKLVNKIKTRILEQQKYTKEIEAKRAEIEKLILDSLTI